MGCSSTIVKKATPKQASSTLIEQNHVVKRL